MDSKAIQIRIDNAKRMTDDPRSLAQHSEKELIMAQITATYECAYQSALLRELLEKSVVNITRIEHNDGRLFKE